MNKGSLTEKLRGSHLAKIVILLIATMAIGGLAGCSSVSAQPGTSSTSTSTGNGSSTGATPTPDPSTTEATPSQQPSQSTTDTSAIDSASADEQMNAFIKAFQAAGFPDIQRVGLAEVDANWGPSYSYGVGILSKGVNTWIVSVAVSDPTSAETISAVAEKIAPDNSNIGLHGEPASVILKIIDSIYFKDGVVYQK